MNVDASRAMTTEYMENKRNLGSLMFDFGLLGFNVVLANGEVEITGVGYKSNYNGDVHVTGAGYKMTYKVTDLASIEAELDFQVRHVAYTNKVEAFPGVHTKKMGVGNAYFFTDETSELHGPFPSAEVAHAFSVMYCHEVLGTV